MSTFSDLCVLYLEDEILIAMDGEAIMEDLGIKCIHAVSNLAEAELTVDQAEVSLAVLDVNVGNSQTSFELARKLKHSGTPVIFTTGYNLNELPSDLHRLPVLEKPLDEIELKRAIEDCCS